MTKHLPDQNLPTELLDKLKQARAQGLMQGERRIVTILFCDVAGSTSMAEQLDPEDWAEIMDDAFDFLIAPVYRYEGTVARLMGDAILAFFGAPIAHEDDPQRALYAALDIVEEIQPFSAKIKAEYGLDFNVRVGINTGMVVVGEIGSDLQVEYTAMGDAVNLAARMEQTAEAGMIQITQETYTSIAPLFDTEPLGLVAVKGKSQPVSTYRVVGRKSDPGRVRGISGLSAAMIGRDAEFTQLEQAMQALKEGRGGIVSIMGEAGLGKSRLIDELRARYSLDFIEDAEFLDVDLAGISFDSHSPYGLFRRSLKHYFGITPDDAPDDAWKKILDADGYLPFPIEGDVLSMLGAMWQLLGLRQEDGESPEGESFKRELFSSYAAIYQKMAAVKPVVMLIDDLHWADPASVELLQHFMRLVDSDPILFILVMRPFRQSPGWALKFHASSQYPHRFTEIDLAPLSEMESYDLVESLLTVADIPPELLQLIQKKADGNPFFIEEVVRTLIDTGAIVQEPHGLRWQAATRVDNIEIPGNVHSLIAARIDRLEKEARRTLQLAAVIGRSFYYRVLAAIHDAMGSLDTQLNDLQRTEMIHEAARLPELEYIFRHELTRDAAYKSILRRDRKRFHHRVAEATEELFANQLEEEAALLAYHFEQAGVFKKAFEYFVMAGHAAARLYANTEAITHYARAIEMAKKLAVPDKQLLSLYTSKGRAEELSGLHDDAIVTYESLIELAQERQDPRMELAALVPQISMHATPTSKYDYARGITLAERAGALAIELDDARNQTKVHWALMLLESFSGEMPKALDHGTQALAIAQKHDFKEELAYVLHDLGRPLLHVGQGEEGIARLQQANQMWRELGNQPMLIDNLASLSQTYGLFGEFEKSLPLAEEALSISQDIGSQWGYAYALSGMATMYLEIGEIDQMIAAARGASEAAKQAGFIGPQYSMAVLLSWLFSELGDRDRAIKEIKQLDASEEKVGSFRGLYVGKDVFLAMLEEDVERTTTLLDEIMTQFAPEEIEPYFGVTIVTILADFLIDNGKANELLGWLDFLIERNEAMGMRVMHSDLLQAKARIMQVRGEHEEAYALLQRAYEYALAPFSRRALWMLMEDLIAVENQRGNAARVKELQAEAKANIEFIADHISYEGLRETFLQQEHIQKLL